ncbi:MAG: glycosyltransferase [Chlamydiota bacterium]|nr:glycosyltransferase [Chlamydiota bacterium]
MDFIVFSDDWGMHPSSCQHIFRHIALKHRVLWVNTIGMRSPRLSLMDLKKVFTKAMNWMRFSHASYDDAEVQVIAPFMLPWHHIRWIYVFNTMMLRWRIHREQEKLKLLDTILVVTVPHLADLFSSIKKKKYVYYRVDDFSSWPGLKHEFIKKEEEKILSEVDSVIASSKPLSTDIMAQCSAVDILEHGVDIDHFSMSGKDVEKPEYMENMGRPIIGFYGLIDERIDQDLLKELALLRTHWSFLLMGEVQTDISILRKCENVYIPGRLKYDDLPVWTRYCDVCIIPYKNNKSTSTITPLKLYEYLAMGKGVVSTPLPAVEPIKYMISVTGDPVSFICAIETFISDGDWHVKDRINYARERSWDKVADMFIQKINATIKV